MTTNRQNKQNGFTLIEVVVVVALVAMASYILIDLFLGQHKLYKTQTAELNITNDARLTLDEIDLYVRQGNRVLSAYGSYTTGPQSMIIQVQSFNSSGRLIAGTYDQIVFYMMGTDLFRQVFSDPASSRQSGVKKLASHVSGFNLTYNSADFSSVTEVITDLTLQEWATYQNRAITVSSKSNLRNY